MAAARAVGVRPEGRVDVRFSALRGERVALPGGAVVINDCYNANPLSMRAALDDLASQEPARRRVAVLGDMLELGADERRAPPRDRRVRGRRRGSTCWSPSGPLAAAMRRSFEGEVHAVADAARPPRGSPRARAARRRRARQGLARRRPGGRGRGARGAAGTHFRAPDGRGPDRRGTASLLICIFLSPKFIAFLREREFGQHIREDGPQEHHAKAGTPTMGGIIIFTAIAVPFLLLTDRDARAIGVFGVALACALLGFADDYTKLVKRRSLGLRGAHEADRHGR